MLGNEKVVQGFSSGARGFAKDAAAGRGAMLTEKTCGVEYRGSWAEFRGAKCEREKDGHELHFQESQVGPLHWRTVKLTAPKKGRK